MIKIHTATYKTRAGVEFTVEYHFIPVKAGEMACKALKNKGQTSVDGPIRAIVVRRSDKEGTHNAQAG